MKTDIATTYVLFGRLVGPARVVIAQDSDAHRSHSIAVVKDSAATTIIKTKRAAEHLVGLEHIRVDTDIAVSMWRRDHVGSVAPSQHH